MNRPTTISLLFYSATFLFGLAISMVMPLFGLFLIDEVQTSPLKMGVMLSVQVAVSTLVSSKVGRYSDQGWSRKRIMMVGQQFLVAALIVYVLSRDYIIIFIASVTLFSLAFPSMSQIYTLGREYYDQNKLPKVEVFMSTMRAGFAVAFVIGPPLAFFIKQYWGFNTVFMLAMVIAELFVLVVWFLPEYSRKPASDTVEAPVQWYKNRSVVLVLVCSLFAFAANTLFTVSLPLYLTKELLLDAQWAGTVLGLAALIEIPMMILAGTYGARIGYQRLMVIGLLSGMLLFVGMIYFIDIRLLLAIQVFNALFVATMHTMGMLLMQSLMQRQMGLAMALFGNTFSLAMLASNLVIGVVAQFFSYHAVYVVGLVMLVFSLLALLSVKQPKRTPLETEEF
jgi:SET family sugar efflux transporter-like MFS transporter